MDKVFWSWGGIFSSNHTIDCLTLFRIGPKNSSHPWGCKVQRVRLVGPSIRFDCELPRRITFFRSTDLIRWLDFTLHIFNNYYFFLIKLLTNRDTKNSNANNLQHTRHIDANVLQKLYEKDFFFQLDQTTLIILFCWTIFQRKEKKSQLVRHVLL